jgi:hypothetical protein
MVSRLRPGFSLASYLASAAPKQASVDAQLEHAARLSYVKVCPSEYRDSLRSMLQFASLLHQVDTRGVEPLEALVDEYQHHWEGQEMPVVEEPLPQPAKYYEVPAMMDGKL